MKKILLILAFSLFVIEKSSAQLYSSQTAKVSFFSKTPMENIEAENKSVLAVMNISTKDLAFSITNTAFEFPNKLMQEHFNEKYIESEKYPKSTFKGKVNESIDLTKDGEYPVTVTGKLNIHGVELDRTIPGTIKVSGGNVELKSNFKVKNADHKIEIPTLVTAKIAEEIDVKVEAVLAPKK